MAEMESRKCESRKCESWKCESWEAKVIKSLECEETGAREFAGG
jgi:hypothetical protein